MTGDLVRSLIDERYGANQWWTRKPALDADPPGDDEMTCAKRRRDLADAFDESNREDGAA